MFNFLLFNLLRIYYSLYFIQLLPHIVFWCICISFLSFAHINILIHVKKEFIHYNLFNLPLFKQLIKYSSLEILQLLHYSLFRCICFVLLNYLHFFIPTHGYRSTYSSNVFCFPFFKLLKIYQSLYFILLLLSLSPNIVKRVYTLQICPISHCSTCL